MNILLIFSVFILVFVIVLYYEIKIKNLSAKFKNNVYFYVARDKNDELWLYIGKPIRTDDKFASSINIVLRSPNKFRYLGLNENDYANLKWEDEPVEVFINMED